MKKCKTCGRELNHATNLGGDCLFCMAEAGDPDASKRCITRARNFDEMENGKRPDLLKPLVDSAVDTERQRCQAIIMHEFEYWRDSKSDQPIMTGIAIGAIGSLSNALVGICLKQSAETYKRQVESRPIDPAQESL
jgi:hypothetical protein